MKENKSPGVDVISPKILKETVERMERSKHYSFIQKKIQETSL